MNHKRGRAKNQRSGCLMCKPHKANGAPAGGEKHRHAVMTKLARSQCRIWRASNAPKPEDYDDEEG